MEQQYLWQGQIDDKLHDFTYTITDGRHVLTVDGVPQKIHPSFISRFFGFQEKIQIDGTQALLVFEKTGPDVVVNGVFSKTGKKHIPRPTWIFIFIVLCLALVVVGLGGLLPDALALLGIAACMIISRTPLHVGLRILICSAITCAVWGSWYLVATKVAELL